LQDFGAKHVFKNRLFNVSASVCCSIYPFDFGAQLICRSLLLNMSAKICCSKSLQDSAALKSAIFCKSLLEESMYRNHKNTYNYCKKNLNVYARQSLELNGTILKESAAQYAAKSL
jgi:hypothetical protein